MLKSPKILHLEVTDVCQAACPQCGREIDPAFDKKTKHYLTVDKLKIMFDEEFILNLDKMFMCGNYGDPAANPHTIDIFKYFRSVNPNITLGMNTNGAINNKKWWKELARVLDRPTDFVVFSIDGLEDTNHIYRKNVVWSKLIENAQTFIDSGGPAQWEMLIFEHNQHQVDLAENLARDMGFYWFRAKVSKRFLNAPVNFLKPPSGYTLPNVIKLQKINCHALNEQSIYVSANGQILPCCWFGAEVFSFDKYAEQLLTDWKQLLVSWEINPHRICASTCGVDEKGTSFSKQWQVQKQLK